MKLRLIGISGKAFSGKDTFAAMLMDAATGGGWETRAIASLLKKQVEEIYSLAPGTASTREGKASLLTMKMPVKRTVEGKETVVHELRDWVVPLTRPSATHPEPGEVRVEYPCTLGKFLQLYGCAMRDRHGEDYWIDELLKTFDSTSSRWIITDVRFPNEKRAIEKAGGIVIRIDSSREVRRERMAMMAVPTDGRDETHPSEIALDGAFFNLIVKNDGSLDDLRRSARRLVPVIDAWHYVS